MGTGMRLLPLVGAAVLAVRWWGPVAAGQEAVAAGGLQRPGPARLRDGLPEQARHPYWVMPPAQLWMNGKEAGGRFEELPSGPPAPPSPAPRALLVVGWLPQPHPKQTARK